MHTPVLLSEVLEALDPGSGQTMIDATVGGGGHGMPIAKNLSPGGVFVGVDWDKSRIRELKETLEKEDLDLDRLILVCGNYANLSEILEKEGLGKADGLLVDLGFSSAQLGTGRGFGFSGPEEPLIMTYDEETDPAYLVLATLAEKEIAEIIKDLSDERYAKRIAGRIVEARKNRPIRTNRDLAEVVRAAVPKNYEHGRIDPATRTFMAFRIYLNRELENLGRLLGELGLLVKPGGRVVIISYHSKEDGMVKHHFKDMEDRGEAELINKKFIGPSDEEVDANRRSRSAKLRAIRMK